MKLIDKDALVAEIERRLNHQVYLSVEREIREQLLNGLLLFINTLEVKEAVDAEIVEFEDDNNSMYAYTHLEICTDEDLSKICKAGDKAKVIIIKQNSYESGAM